MKNNFKNWYLNFLGVSIILFTVIFISSCGKDEAFPTPTLDKEVMQKLMGGNTSKRGVWSFGKRTVTYALYDDPDQPNPKTYTDTSYTIDITSPYPERDSLDAFGKPVRDSLGNRIYIYVDRLDSLVFSSNQRGEPTFELKKQPFGEFGGFSVLTVADPNKIKPTSKSITIFIIAPELKQLDYNLDKLTDDELVMSYQSIVPRIRKGRLINFAATVVETYKKVK